MAKSKASKERKALTLHKHYLIDLRRFKEFLSMDETDYGRPLVIKKTSMKLPSGLKTKAITIALA